MALKAGWEDAGNNLVKNTATGQMVDQNHPIYTSAPGPAVAAPAGAAAPAGSAPATAGQALSAPATAGATTAPGAPTTAAGAFQQALVNRLTAPAPSAQSAAIQPALQANRLSEQRGFERNRAMLAERSAANGTDAGGGFETQLMGLAQDRAGREGQFAGQAVSGLAQQQSQELTQALALGGNLLSQQDQLAMQDKLAALNAQVQRESLAQQGSLGNKDLDIRNQLGQGNLNLGLLSALLQNDQYGKGLGLQAGIAGQQFNQQALLGLLGAL